MIAPFLCDNTLDTPAGQRDHAEYNASDCSECVNRPYHYRRRQHTPMMQQCKHTMRQCLIKRVPWLCTHMTTLPAARCSRYHCRSLDSEHGHRPGDTLQKLKNCVVVLGHGGIPGYGRHTASRLPPLLLKQLGRAAPMFDGTTSIQTEVKHNTQHETSLMSRPQGVVHVHIHRVVPQPLTVLVRQSLQLGPPSVTRDDELHTMRPHIIGVAVCLR